MTPITEDEFPGVLAGFTHTAFRVEVQSAYAMKYERADFERFLAGSPTPPPEMTWYQPWADKVRRWTYQEGKTLTRVRVLDDPPTDYQRWLLWAAPWFAAIGEEIRYMRRSTLLELGLPFTSDWWLLDDERVIVMRFTPEGETDGKTLITNPELVAKYCASRDIATRNSQPAETIPA